MPLYRARAEHRHQTLGRQIDGDIELTISQRSRIQQTMRSIALLGLGTVLCLSGAAGGTAPDRPVVIAYVAGAWSEDYDNCHACEWRVYRPQADEDVFVTALAEDPHAVVWDDRFERVEYRVGRMLYQLRWAVGAQPERLGILPDAWNPVGEDIEPWLERTSGAWRVSVAEGRGTDYRVRMLELTPTGHWRVVAETPVGGCAVLDEACWSRVRRPKALPTNSLEGLHEAMRIEAHIPSANIPDDEHGKPVEILSRTVPNRSLRTRAVAADSGHALRPLLWVDKKTGRSRVIPTAGGKCETGRRQLAFAERGPFLLIVEEFTGRCPVVFDLRSGVVRRRLPNAGLAVWVIAPTR